MNAIKNLLSPFKYDVTSRKKLFIESMLFLSMLTYPLNVASSPISLKVLDGDLRAVFYSIAQTGELDIILDDDVTGKITLSLDEIEAQDAISYIAQTQGLHITQQKNTFLIRKEKDLHKHLYLFPMKHADAKDIVITLQNIFAPENTFTTNNADEKRKTNNFHFETDETKNTVLFYGTANEANEIENVLTRLDVPMKQISIETKVMAVEKNALKNLGLSWEWSKIPQSPKYSTRTESKTKILPNGKKETIDVPTTEVERTWRQGENIPGIISFGRSITGHPFEFYYGAELNALFAEGKANILARPNITTIEGKEAIINIGGEIPIPTVAVTNATTTTSYIYRPAGIMLRCLPKINASGKILAKIYTEISSPHYVEEMKVYRFNRRLAETTVALNDGETIIIGGLIGTEESKNFSKIPFLGDLPILGKFFQSIKKNKTESEVMIFLTAKILQ